MESPSTKGSAKLESLLQAPSVLSKISSASLDSALDTHINPLKLFQKSYLNSSPSLTSSLGSIVGLSSANAVGDIVLPSDQEIDFIRSNENFEGVEFSDLFVKIFYNVLKSIERNPAGNLTSPGLTGSRGTVPLTIISTVPEIADHYYNLIVKARLDIIIFSNFWKNSYASRRIGEALKELSNQIEEDGRSPVVVKILFDRGSLQHFVSSRVRVEEAEWITLGLPPSKQMRNIQLEIINYHNFPLGTLHSKFMVIDRQVAVLNSCNIQDNSNLEMMCQFDGPIIESLYEHAIITWGDGLNPTLPSLSARRGSLPSQIQDWQHVDTPPMETQGIGLTMVELNKILNKSMGQKTAQEGVDDLMERPFCAYNFHTKKQFPIALVNRAPHSAPGNPSLDAPQNIAWLSGIKFAEAKIFIQTPDLNAPPVVTALIEAIKRGVEVSLVLCMGYNDLGEMLPLQGGHNEIVVVRMKQQLNEEEKKLFKVYWYVGRDLDRPIHATKQIRTCHIKLMIVDERIGIQGSGNQDSQSWFHSQEINCMIDSEDVCRDWMKQLKGNQNSFVYGAGDAEDGIWRDEKGKEAEESIGSSSGIKAWVSGSSSLVRGKFG
ncbi:hypothetical protein H072_9996 [Dactylellina haptotyla CBS 200.50]|uniref:PLD phosphodiesterase domain-containing protein n=1 Tax=Dactylellina haptotyla (strain CBS 200.50) TaxID=1284197 RepID=S8A5P4_DACHA|nr:hypothetical protein H072_9996 [Dactylellina haptotyla CBS 200.50]